MVSWFWSLVNADFLWAWFVCLFSEGEAVSSPWTSWLHCLTTQKQNHFSFHWTHRHSLGHIFANPQTTRSHWSCGCSSPCVVALHFHAYELIFFCPCNDLSQLYRHSLQGTHIKNSWLSGLGALNIKPCTLKARNVKFEGRGAHRQRERKEVVGEGALWPHRAKGMSLWKELSLPGTKWVW